jgi:hypothetical protein
MPFAPARPITLLLRGLKLGYPAPHKQFHAHCNRKLIIYTDSGPDMESIDESVLGRIVALARLLVLGGKSLRWQGKDCPMVLYGRRNLSFQSNKKPPKP